MDITYYHFRLPTGIFFTYPSEAEMDTLGWFNAESPAVFMVPLGKMVPIKVKKAFWYSHIIPS
jgi:hypothetical protein